MASPLAKTPLHDWHVTHGGRMVDFAGWSMPVQYSSIVAEHNATRTAAGLFDVSHMGRFRFFGENAAPFLDRVVTRRITDMQPGQVRYGLVTNDEGGILDDVLVYRLTGHPEHGTHLMVVNASNREKIFKWLANHNLDFVDETLASAMIAVQGPAALELLKSRITADLPSLKYYHAVETTLTEHWSVVNRSHNSSLAGKQVLVSRTGYTGEDGVELIVSSGIAADIWSTLLAAGHDRGVMAAGLGARDTLRLEAAMPLYGHELNEEINPIEAGLNFAVNLDGRWFPGCERLQKIKREGPNRVRIGLELSGKRAAREHYGIYDAGQLIGEVTSGTFSPTLEKPIAMGYVPPQFATPGTKLEIDIRGSREPATVVTLPFYRRAKSN
jgi:aminomethyltransferase